MQDARKILVVIGTVCLFCVPSVSAKNCARLPHPLLIITAIIFFGPSFVWQISLTYHQPKFSSIISSEIHKEVEILWSSIVCILFQLTLWNSTQTIQVCQSRSTLWIKVPGATDLVSEVQILGSCILHKSYWQNHQVDTWHQVSSIVSMSLEIMSKTVSWALGSPVGCRQDSGC